MSANKEFSELFKIAYSYPELYLNFIKNAYTPLEDLDKKMDENADAQVESMLSTDTTARSYARVFLDELKTIPEEASEEDLAELEDLRKDVEKALQRRVETSFSNNFTLDTVEKIKKAVSRYLENLVTKARGKSTTASFNENMSVLHNALAEEFSKKTASADKRKYAQVFDLLSQKDINEHLRRKYAEAQNRPFLVTVTCTTVKHEDAEHGEIPYGKRDAQVQEELSEECADLEELKECLQEISSKDKYKGWSSGDIQITPSSVSIDLVDPEPGEAHSRSCTVHVTCNSASCKEVVHMVSKFFS